MQFTLHATRRTPHDASRLVQTTSATWLVKTRRAPSRHSRDARAYGHTTTAMHKLSTHPAPSHICDCQSQAAVGAVAVAVVGAVVPGTVPVFNGLRQGGMMNSVASGMS